jgi:hypothetical protein
MSRTTRKLALVPFLAAALLGAGCSTTVNGSPAPTGGGGSAPADGGVGATTTDDPVAWADQVCGATLGFLDSVSQPPDVAGSGDPAAALQGFGEYFGTIGQAAGATADAVRAAGPAPVDNGEQIANQLVSNLETLESTLGDLQTQIENADPNDPEALADALGDLENLPSDPIADIESNPELEAAFDQAPNCQQVEQAAGTGGN